MLHIYSGDFKVKKSFASAGEVYDFNGPFQVAYSEFDPYACMCVVDSTKVLFTQKYNYGFINLYKLKGNKWVLEKLTGKVFNKAPFKVLRKYRRSPKNKKEYVNVWNSKYGKFYYKDLCVNMGIFLLNDGKIVHFFLTKKDKYIFYAEIFNKNGDYIGVGCGSFINFQSYENKDYVPIDGILWKDKDDKFYVRALVNGLPAVRVLQLKYSINK